jgi:hypothetical protein
MGKNKHSYRILVRQPEGKNHWEDQEVGGWTILKRMLERLDGVVWTGLVWIRIGSSEELL